MEIKYRPTYVCLWLCVYVIVQRYQFLVVRLFAMKKYKQFTDLLLFTRSFSLSCVRRVPTAHIHFSIVLLYLYVLDDVYFYWESTNLT